MSQNDKPIVLRGPSKEDQDMMFWSYIRSLGLCVHSWNGLLESLCDLFTFAKDCNEDISRAKWHNIKSDREQIQGLLKLIKSTHDRWAVRFPKAKVDLVWLTEEALKLLDRRNDLLHSSYTLYCDRSGWAFKASTLTGNRRALNLQGIDLAIEFELFRGRADALSRFSTDCQAPIKSVSDNWPDRPSNFNISDTTTYVTTYQLT